MLLETLDIKKDDVVIFSRNIFDLEKNFKIIYKDDEQKSPHKISYNEVCRFVNEFTPKNMIVYRLLTNIKDFEIYLSKYGFYLSINNVTELIYFDPVFAIKELEDYSEAINYYDLRFRIQQVGLTTLNRKGNLPNFAEIYNIDLQATEAKFQNDMAFAEAIFAFAGKSREETRKLKSNEINRKPVLKEPRILEQKPSVKSEQENNFHHQSKPGLQIIKKDEVKPAAGKSSEPVKKQTTQTADGIKLINHDISEDKDFDYKQIMRINFKGTAGANNEYSVSKNEKEEKTEQDLGKTGGVVPRIIKHSPEGKKTFGSILKDANAKNNSGKTSKTGSEEKTSAIIDIFKSSSSLKNYLTGRENKKVVLKMNKK